MAASKPPFHRQLLTGFLQLVLLLGISTLPSLAFAVDTDGDGVPDNLDAFPNNAEATVDTDGDGAPDTINNSLAPIVFSDNFSGSSFQSGWIRSSSAWTVVDGAARFKYGGGSSAKLKRIFDVPLGGALLRFSHVR